MKGQGGARSIGATADDIHLHSLRLLLDLSGSRRRCVFMYGHYYDQLADVFLRYAPGR
jgi:hypothetical protein